MHDDDLRNISQFSLTNKRINGKIISRYYCLLCGERTDYNA